MSERQSRFLYFEWVSLYEIGFKYLLPGGLIKLDRICFLYVLYLESLQNQRSHFL